MPRVGYRLLAEDVHSALNRQCNRLSAKMWRKAHDAEVRGSSGKGSPQVEETLRRRQGKQIACLVQSVLIHVHEANEPHAILECREKRPDPRPSPTAGADHQVPLLAHDGILSQVLGAARQPNIQPPRRTIHLLMHTASVIVPLSLECLLWKAKVLDGVTPHQVLLRKSGG